MDWQQLVNSLVSGIEGNDPGAIAGAIAGMIFAGVGNAFDIATALQAGQAVEVTNPETGESEILEPVTVPADQQPAGVMIGGVALDPVMLAVLAILAVLVLRR